MASTDAGQGNDKGREWSSFRPRQRYGNAARRLPDGFGRRLDPGPPPGPLRRSPSRPAPGQRVAEGPGSGAVEGDRPTLSAIISAVEEMRETLPRIGVGGIYQQFRCRGGRWALVTREDVRVALAGIECAARREFLFPAAETIRRPAPRTPQGSWPQFRQAVAELRDRGADVAGIVRTLREAGWQRVSHDDVAGALRRIKAANTPRHFQPGRSLPAPRQAGPGICPSCGVRVTDLGLCRCS